MVVMPTPDRLVAWLLSGQLHEQDLTLLAQSLDRPVNGGYPKARYLDTRPTVNFPHRERPVRPTDALEDGVSLPRVPRLPHAPEYTMHPSLRIPDYH